MPAPINFLHTAGPPFATPAFPVATNNPVVHGSLGIGGLPTAAGTSSHVNPPGSTAAAFFPSLFPSSAGGNVAFAVPSFLTATSAQPLGSLYSGGLHGGSAAGAVVKGSPFVGYLNGNATSQKPLFTIGQAPPSQGTTKRKRVLVRDLTPRSR